MCVRACVRVCVCMCACVRVCTYIPAHACTNGGASVSCLKEVNLPICFPVVVDVGCGEQHEGDVQGEASVGVAVGQAVEGIHTRAYMHMCSKPLYNT